MARSSVNYTVSDEGRDHGKVFVLSELSAARAESWAMRALLALMASGVQVPEGFERMGMAAMAEIGIRTLSGLKWEVAEPLLAEMWECVQIIPDPSKPYVIRRLIDEDTEEITTRVKLRAEVWKLHTGFLKAVAPLISGATPAAASKKATRNM
jgi:hypothetical protein